MAKTLGRMLWIDSKKRVKLRETWRSLNAGADSIPNGDGIVTLGHGERVSREKSKHESVRFGIEFGGCTHTRSGSLSLADVFYARTPVALLHMLVASKRHSLSMVEFA